MGDLKNPFGKLTELLILRNPETFELIRDMLIEKMGVSLAVANNTAKIMKDAVRRDFNASNQINELKKSLNYKDEEDEEITDPVLVGSKKK